MKLRRTFPSCFSPHSSPLNFSLYFLSKINTYNPLLHLFPEDFKLLELQHPSVVHLAHTSRKKMWRCSCFQTSIITTVNGMSMGSILVYSILFYYIVFYSILFYFILFCVSKEGMEGYIHQINDAMAGGERQSIKLDLFSCRSEKKKDERNPK